MSDSRLRTTSFATEQNGGPDEVPTALTGVSVQQTPHGRVTKVVATRGGSDSVTEEISYSDTNIIGKGSFGVVFSVYLHTSECKVAIKKVLQDRRYKNRELQIMRSLNHPNITALHYFFYSSGSKKDEIYLNLVVEFVPESLYHVLKRRTRANEALPMLLVQMLSFQMFRALGFLHAKGICHRDIKPHNLLVDEARGILKLCDFGSAKVLVEGEPNVAYICSRYYRAPELIFGASNYSTKIGLSSVCLCRAPVLPSRLSLALIRSTCAKIDCWSAGCVLAELLLGQPLFPGESGVDQLVEIIKVLGTPTKDQIRAMNPEYQTFRFPQIRAQQWSDLLPAHAPESLASLCTLLLAYQPSDRLSMWDAMAHPFFEDLRQPNAALNGQSVASLFDFNQEEFELLPHVYENLIPSHLQG
ncbi:uncharacterized protein MONBRDRAFT_8104 [Monosiga brevicollis MX1]|uniref:Protein kinase domain-containing protein n=1 Tax=Monosiga brevicollis TaxID=81824 RepID=A9UZ23_MONBE|nr:uncharacterized protein MONBRDRAFT_8104 [Monosiga brevicollis MX1]EDQ89558.1 predicted protein [Monosiga brevicollis MX1]|eukprot:XP_001745587.1 hypothetical protein [Monosiga brevicollis MX1]